VTGTGELGVATLARAQQGDSAALTELVKLYGGRVHALVWRVMAGHPRAEVEDLCQEALVKVVHGLPRFDPAGTARLSTWILTVATRACIDRLRREQRRPEAPLPDEPIPAGDEASPELTASRRELARRAEQTMAALPDGQRAVLVLRAYHDMDYDEIARVLEIEVGTVKSRLGRARLALRRLMAESQGAA
jgi:RNA polymerase sigma-70 factor (ECF subfamily)